MATYSYSGDPASSPKDAVRFWIQDTGAPWKVSDEEINYTLTQFSDPIRAAAQIAKALAAKYAAYPSKRVGDFEIQWGELAKNYAAIAAQLEATANTRGVIPYSGGISHADKRQVNSNIDRVKPPFRIDQYDNPQGPNNTAQGNWNGPWGGDD